MPTLEADRLERLRYLQELHDRQQRLERATWESTARPEQLTPDGDWNVWLLLAGRGYGKTRTGAEDAADYGRTHPGSRIAIVAPTIGDARDTCVEGESGLLNTLGQRWVKNWNRSLGELTLTNGSRYKTFSADEPDRLRGPQHHRAWCDELAAWRYPDAWDQLMFGLRLGERPQVVATTTPRPVKLVRDLLKRADVHVTRGSTFDNADNLAPAALAQLKLQYEGTTLGRQELYGELLDQLPGALPRHFVDDNRVDDHPDLQTVVVAIDPAVTNNEESDETGIVVFGISGRHGYVLDDLTCRQSPEGWARIAVDAYRKHNADRIVAEVNNGGDLVASVIRTVDPRATYKQVRATRGKQLRAQPVTALYEQGRIHHVGIYPALEDQLCQWTPDSDVSPDRLDALVWAATDTLVEAPSKKLSRAMYSNRGRL